MIGGGKRKYEEVVEEGRVQKVQKSRSSQVPRSKGSQSSKGPEEQDISKSHSNTSLTL